MILRMKHIKMNLLLRRSGKLEKTFVEFYNALTKDEMAQFKQNSRAADFLQNGVFLIKKGKVLRGLGSIIQSVWNDPKYLGQKIKSNSGFFK